MRTLTMVMINVGELAELNKVFISEKYEFITLTDKEILQCLKSNDTIFTNIKVENGKIVTSNGNIERYGAYNTVLGRYERPLAPVILNRVEEKNELIGYTALLADGTVRELTVAQAVKVHESSKFANGKLVPTETSKIISSINGTYPLRKISVNKKDTDNLKYEYTLNTMLFGSMKNKEKLLKYVGVMVKFNNAYASNTFMELLEKDNFAIIKLACELLKDKKDGTVDNYKQLRDSIIEDISNVRISANMIYAVISLDSYMVLLKKSKNKKQEVLKNKNIVCLDFTDNPIDSPVESCIKTTESGAKLEAGTDGGNKAVKQYLDKIKEDLENIK